MSPGIEQVVSGFSKLPARRTKYERAAILWDARFDTIVPVECFRLRIGTTPVSRVLIVGRIGAHPSIRQKWHPTDLVPNRVFEAAEVRGAEGPVNLFTC